MDDDFDDSQEVLEDKILDELSDELMSVSELADRLDTRRDFLAGYLECMKDQDKLEKMEVGKAHVYQVKD